MASAQLKTTNQFAHAQVEQKATHYYLAYQLDAEMQMNVPLIGPVSTVNAVIHVLKILVVMELGVMLKITIGFALVQKGILVIPIRDADQ